MANTQRAKLATNADSLKRIYTIAEAMHLQIATPEEVRGYPETISKHKTTCRANKSICPSMADYDATLDIAALCAQRHGEPAFQVC